MGDMALVLSEPKHLAGAAFGEIIRDGLKVVIAGPPNSGKSSLMNALAERDVAIVTNIAGTTRTSCRSILISTACGEAFDTAGLRETEEVVEVEGFDALKKIGDADIVLSLAEGRTCRRAVSDSAARGANWNKGRPAAR